MATLEKEGAHLIVSGRVQGVFYRRFTKTQADALNITGWARNLPDGTVEIKAFGEKPQLDALLKKLWQGPPAAKVADIKFTPIPLENHTNFNI